MTHAPHPPYSPDFTPTDFFLFGDIKQQFSGCSFDDADNLLSLVQEILDGFEKLALIWVFNERQRRLEQYPETQGEFFE
jgi:hypothetical protein